MLKAGLRPRLDGVRVHPVVRLISRDTGRAFAVAIEVGGMMLATEACASTSSVEATTRAVRL
jgi:hypothetical protein